MSKKRNFNALKKSVIHRAAVSTQWPLFKSKTMKSLNFIVPLVVYPFDVMVSIGETDQQLEKTLGKYFTDDNATWRWHNETAQGRFCLFSTNQGLIRLRRLPATPEDYGNLQHEIFHYVTSILDRIGMKLVIMKSDEAYAYMIGYLTSEIYKRITRCPAKRK